MQRVLAHLAQNEQRFVDQLVEHASLPSVSAQPQHKPDLIANAGSRSPEEHLEHMNNCEGDNGASNEVKQIASASPIKCQYEENGQYDVRRISILLQSLKYACQIAANMLFDGRCTFHYGSIDEKRRDSKRECDEHGQEELSLRSSQQCWKIGRFVPSITGYSDRLG